MINLMNDYNVIAHNKILKDLLKYQTELHVGYGMDDVCVEAKELIKKELNNYDVDIHFLVGGTLTNKIALNHILKPYEAIIAADSAHICVHETGAIESNGHKIITVKNVDGKVTVDAIHKVMKSHTDCHMVKPKVVYISNSTEYGTIYTKSELFDLSNYCKHHGLYLYLDGARLGTALTSKYNDLTLSDICKYVDIFYIGGTKNGLMFGEALVVKNENLKENFRYTIKQNGGMLSKGFLLGIQFKTLFTDGLFYEIAKNQNELATYLDNGLNQLYIRHAMKTVTNQIFITLDKEVVEKLKKHILFEVWEDLRDEQVIRFVTHLSLTKEDIDKALNIIKESLDE